MMKLLLHAFVLLATNAWAVSGSRAVAPGDELPDGEGKKILQTSCTSCHDLGEVTKFRGYYDRAQWRDVVVTMVEYGAPLQPPEIDTLADYLEQHLGRRN
jgi:mono/diheme cytochrome c family protein